MLVKPNPTSNSRHLLTSNIQHLTSAFPASDICFSQHLTSAFARSSYTSVRVFTRALSHILINLYTKRRFLAGTSVANIEMTAEVQKTRVAILVEQHFEDSEFQVPYNALQEALAEVTVLGSRVNETYQGKNGEAWIKADATTTKASDILECYGATFRIRTGDLLITNQSLYQLS